MSELVEACKAHAEKNRRQLPTELTSLAEWRRRHEELIKVLEAVRRVSQPTHLPQAPRIHARIIAEWSPIDLGVKKAIEGTGRTLTELTPYITRDCDQEIREALSEDGRSIFIVVTGDSGAGKTRACLEAIRTVTPGKFIIFPTGPHELSELLEDNQDISKCIIWLDELQGYLDGEESSKIGNILTKLLITSKSPVTFIGTMWPEYWQSLTTRPPEHEPDHSARVRRLLGLSHVRRIRIEATFSTASPEAIAAAVKLDGRIAVAATSCGSRHNIAQVLAGGIHLLDRYVNSLDSREKAIITAAMDFRRIGFHSPASTKLLEDSTEGYLSAEQRVVSSDWINTAIEGAAWKVNGIRALEPARVAHGLGPADSYILHDYLDDYAQHSRRDLPIPASTWHALNIHAHDPDDRVRISWQATFRGYKRLSVEFLSAVIVADYSAEGGLRLTWAFEEAGHPEKAMETLRRAAEAGESSAMRELARRLTRSQERNSAMAWLRRAAELNDTEAMVQIGSHPFFIIADFDEAQLWLQRAADLGDIWAMRKLGYQNLEFSPPFALRWLRRGAETGEGNLMLDLIEALHANAMEEECNEWIQRLGESGHLHMIGPLAEWLEQLGRNVEAEKWLQRYADLGDMTACSNLSELLDRSGRRHEAVTVWRNAIESLKLGSMSTIAARRIADQIRRAGEVVEAAQWLRRAADDRSPFAILILIELIDVPEAESLVQKAIALGNSYAVPALVDILERSKRNAEAERLLRDTLEGFKYFNASETLKHFLKRNGRAEEAEFFERFGIEPGGETATPW